MTKSNTGFTLIELMVVVVIASILLGVAIPSYRGYVIRANRADAKISMLRIASLQEKYYLQNGRYAGSTEIDTVPPTGLGLTTGKSDNGYYALSLVSAEGGLAVGYTATAAHDGIGKQGTDIECISFSIDQNGRRGANGGYVTEVVEKCWS